MKNWDDLNYHNRPFSAHGSYAESKLLDAMLTFETAERLIRMGIATSTLTYNCLDPGTVNTKMLLAGWGPIGIDVNDALDETWLCTSPEVRQKTGSYFVSRMERKASSSAYDPNERARLWKILSKADQPLGIASLHTITFLFLFFLELVNHHSSDLQCFLSNFLSNVVQVSSFFVEDVHDFFTLLFQ